MKKTNSLFDFTCDSKTTMGDRQENQDFTIYSQNSQDPFVCFGVLDGHGIGGLQAASNCTDIILSKVCEAFLNSKIDDEDIIMENIKKAFAETQIDLLKVLSKMPEECGTTALLMVMSGDLLITCNVGDCRALIFRKSEEKGSKSLDCFELSNDHSLDREDEVERITSTTEGQVVEGSSGDWRLIPSSAAYELSIVKAKKLALGMSRSFGHVILSKFGAICEPEFTVHQIKDGDMLVAATDGVWGILENDEVGHIVDVYRSNPSSIASRIVSTVKQRCLKDDTTCDNTTCLVTHFTEKNKITPKKINSEQQNNTK
eukprot:TRINITY_DN6963_c1_g3_i1.p1 TRINITY_DN6963_c1_g3~~TRINITY_DN6963_c1_g3_i1.p1  ORF type:complete len:315 (+),score=93.51 TRINITY_DN6963_c1_g3_i1:938-1882(+)